MPWEICSLTAPKIFVEEPFRASENFWNGKMSRIRGGNVYHEVPSKICCGKVPKKIVCEPFCFRKVLESEVVKNRRGGRVSRIAEENLLS